MLDGVSFYELVLHPPVEQQGQESADIVGETKLVRSLGFVADLRHQAARELLQRRILDRLKPSKTFW